MRYHGTEDAFTYLGREFNSDSRSLFVFDTKRTHNSIGMLIQTTHFEHSFNAVNRSDEPFHADYRILLTMPPFLRWVLTAVAAVSRRKEAPRARSSEPSGCPSVARNRYNHHAYKDRSL